MLKFYYLAHKSLVIGEPDIIGKMWVNPEQIARINLTPDGRCQIKFRNSELFEVLNVCEEELDEVAKKIWERSLSEVE
jgi:hypothetical protein